MTANRAGFVEALTEHQKMVFSIAYHYLWDRDLAEEAAQETFLELHRHWEAIESGNHLVFWLRRVAARKAIDAGRKRRRRGEIGLEAAPEPRSGAGVRDFLLEDKLRNLVASLPEKQRLVVTLRYQEDLDPAEIAGVLEMPVATVKSHLQRALALLREKTPRVIGEVRA